MSDAGNQAAFPSDKHFGLTKREYFAGLAMQAILSNPTVAWKDNPVEKIATQSVIHSDALLAALEGKG